MVLPVVLITGTSSGIGLALLKEFQKTGKYRIVATARQSSLSILAQAGFHDSDALMVRPLDILSQESGREVVREVETVWGGVDILINNAGISFRSAIEEMTEAEEELQMRTNYLGPIALVRAVLPSMRAKRDGHIVNISSVGGMMAMPTMGSYSASKFALEGASEALWYELKPWNITVSLVQPGFVNSRSYERVRRSEQSKRSVSYQHYYVSMQEFVGKLMRHAWATPESIAKRIVRIPDDPSPPLRIPVTLDAHVFGALRRLLPRSWYHGLLYSRLPDVKHWANGKGKA